MSLPWFFDDPAVDQGALEQLEATATSAATQLDEVAHHRLTSTTRNLARCAGPYAEDLADDALRAVGRDRALADACRQLATAARLALEAAAADRRHRLSLQDAFRAEEARDRAAAASASVGSLAAVALARTSGSAR